ncbi:MAG: FxsA family protein [Acidimicrobiia bacterium]|nr:FxsA family protein [Acidimicrobiia bacterium]
MALGPLLFALFLVVPVAEIALFIAIGDRIGVITTLALIVITAFVGAALVSRQGRQTMARLRAEIAEQRVPTRQLSHGAMILVAGALLLTPGFITDTVGFALLVPPIRTAIHDLLAVRLRSRFVRL